MNSIVFTATLLILCCFLIYATPVKGSETLQSLVEVQSETEFVYTQKSEEKKAKRNLVTGSTNALRLKNLYRESLVPYCSRSGKLNLKTCYWCKRSTVTGDQLIGTIFDSGSETFGYVAYNVKNARLTVAFRGSANFKNWMTNVKASPVNYPYAAGAKVHKGFYKAYTSVKPRIVSLLNKVSRYNIKQVYVIGHSLGGALAQISVPAVRRHFKSNIIHLITFGSPRVGNLQFANYIHYNVKEATRVTNYRDPVPHVPGRLFNSLNGNSVYFHAGRETVVKGSSTTYCKDKEQCNSIGIPSINAHLQYFGIDFKAGSSFC